METTGPKLKVIWEEIPTPDAAERLAAAFSMLLGTSSPKELPTPHLDSHN
jgi:hypothetical protein